VLSRLPGKARKCSNIKILLRFCNAVRQDESTLKIPGYFVLVPQERGRNKFAILSVESPAWQGAKV